MAQIPLDLNKIAVDKYNYGEVDQQMIDAILEAIDKDQDLVNKTNDHQPGYVNVNGMDIFYNPALNSSHFRDKDGNYDLNNIWRNIEYLPTTRKMNNGDVERLAGRLNEWNTLKLLPALGSQKLAEKYGLGFYRNPNAVGINKGKTILSVMGKGNVPQGWVLANSSFGQLGDNDVTINGQNLSKRAETGNWEDDGYLFNFNKNIRTLSNIARNDPSNPYQAGDLKQYPPTTNAYGGYSGYNRYDDGGMMPPDQGMGGGSPVDQVLAMLSQLPPDQLQQVVQALMQMAQGGGMPPQGDPSMMQDPSMGGMPPQGGMPPEGMMAYGGYNRYANGGNISRRTSMAFANYLRKKGY